jgi:lipopolysaccharide/colanic/teichoic acid biosynthesis glycosyltransferase
MLRFAIKRIFDILLSVGGIVILSPIFILLWCTIRLESKGKAIFKQTRVGKNNIDFTLYKFRTMYLNSESKGQITIGMKDPRITRIGYYLRKFKLDELPQLFNVLSGDMSFVGPRPEVRKYVDMYTNEQLKVLSIKPGITDYASIKYFNENELLGKSSSPHETYIHEIMPEKLRINMIYVENSTLLTDLRIIFTTLGRFFHRSK